MKLGRFYSLTLLLFLPHHAASRKIQLTQPTVILISFDGFRWDYLDREGVETPNFDSIVRNGVRARHLINAFVTKTLPNHFTIVTGLYEESHGIMANTMYDPVFKELFYVGSKTFLDAKWWNGEPIWVTNQKALKTSAVVLWPGSEVKIEGQYPSHYLRYNASIPYERRIDYVISQLEQDNPPSFLAAYFDEPDHAGHRFGPDSPEVNDAIRMADNTTGYLLDKLRKLGLSGQVNLIITSDHGMTELNSSRVISLDKYISAHSYTVIEVPGTENSSDAFLHILPKEGMTEKIYQSLKGAHEHLHVYKKEEIPEEFHYNRNRRVMPIFVVGDDGWMIVQNSSTRVTLRGNHGYSNKYADMHPFFIAQGPVFKKNFISEPFENVNIYPLMCHILGITPSPNNGSLESVQQLLKTNPKQQQNFTILIVISVISFLTFIFMSYGIVSFCVKNRCKLRHYGHIYDLGTDLDL